MQGMPLRCALRLSSMYIHRLYNISGGELKDQGLAAAKSRYRNEDETLQVFSSC